MNSCFESVLRKILIGEFTLIDDRIKEKIEQLDENEAKAMLKIIYGFVATAKTGDGGDAMIRECVDEIANCYQSIPEVKNNKK